MEEKIQEDYFKALGKLVIKSGDLELLYKKLFTLIAHVEPFTAEIIIAKMSFTRFLELLVEIAKRYYKSQSTLIENLIRTVKLAQEAINKRNEIFHSGWIPGIPNDENVYYRYKIDLRRDDYLNEEGKACSIEEIGSLENEFVKAIDSFGKFMSDFILKKKKS